ncbi:hypothetical protein GCM10017673_44410 [Streptosporangium violaceochromogenes]|nr:hypothetical protein GCM10017673_44410 [Streptosporangium violaceochromogenes]
MLAPVLLAAGLLVAELTGYRSAVEGIVAEAKAAGAGASGDASGDAGGVAPIALASVRGVPLEPRIVPPPHRPDRVYGGWAPPVVVTNVPPSVREAARVGVPPVTRGSAPRKPPEPRVSRTPRPERSRPGFGCPSEWRETWLWEVCKEQVGQMT